MLAPAVLSVLLVLGSGQAPGQAIRIPVELADPAPEPQAPHARVPATAPLSPTFTLSGTANVRVNDPSQLPGPAGDITPSVAANGNQVLVVWRVIGALATQRLRAAFSSDGGNSFTDIGWLPNPPGNWRWGVDPCVEVDPFDGTFLVGAQAIDPGLPATGIGIITGKVVGGTFTWGASAIAHATGYVGALLGDQLHMTFDATNFSWHMVFHDGYVSPSALIHRMSVDHGSTWFAPDTIATDAPGYVGVAPRVAFVGGRGPIVTHTSSAHGSWWEPITFSVSRFSWPSFQPAVPVSSFRFEPCSFPGTQVDRLSAPSIAVDRTSYLFSNRVYVAWVQSATLSPWPAAGGISLNEAEPNDTPATANALGASSGHITGAMSSNADADVFSVTVPAGRHLVLEPESMTSVGVNSNVRTEIVAADGTHTLGFTSMLPTDTGTAHELFTAPRTATYFIRVTGFNITNYQLKLAYSDETPAPALDRRDVMTSYSTDLGVSWSAPLRLPVSGPGYDAALVDVVVGNDGRPYLFWIDFVDPMTDGSMAVLKTTRSDDGGVTWETPHIISTAASDWQPITTTSNGVKTGDRLDATTTPIPLAESPAVVQATASRRLAAYQPAEDLHVTWTDARDGEGNIYAAHFPTGFEVLATVSDTTAVPGQTVALRMVLQNRNTVFSEQITPSFVACQRSWSSSFAPFSLGPETTQSLYPFLVSVPDSAAAGAVLYQATIHVGGQTYGLNTLIHVQSTSAVGPGGAPALAFEPPSPNPMRGQGAFRFSLPAAATPVLEVFDLGGAHVRGLMSGAATAGSHDRVWDLRDDRGRRVAPGLYLARLTVGDFTRVRRVIVLP